MASAQLVRKRATIQAKITWFAKFLANLQAKQDLSEVDLFEIKERVQAIEVCKSEFDQIQSDIELSCDNDTELDAQLEKREAFDNKYYSSVSLARKILHENGNTSQDSQSDVSAAQSQASMGNHLSNVRLPTISLPKYSGSYHNWLEFRDTFQSLIHSNGALSGVQKFHYLRASLEGDAAQVIKSLELSEANYNVAWNALLERYNSDRLLIQNHVRALFNLDQMHKETAAGIRKILDDVNKNLRALEQLKEPVESWDTLLIYLIGSKLDSNSLKNWESFKSENSHPTFDDLKIFLKNRAEVLEAIAQNDVKRHSSSRENINARGNSRSFVVTKDSNETNCVVCNGKHFVSGCEKFSKLSPTDRLFKAKQLRLCLNCLKKGHFSRVCRAKTCEKCREKHHVLLHNTKPEGNGSSLEAKENTEISGDGQKFVGNSNGRMQGSSQNPENPVAFSAFSGVNQVLLSTALVKILDKNGEAVVTRVLLDNGAQSSFITRNLSERLGLPKERVRLSIRGFNQKSSSIHNKCKVNLQAMNGAFETELHCFVLDVITGSLPQNVLDPYELKIPQNIKLADPTFWNPSPVEMLIGADLYYEVVCARMITLENGPVLLKTRFGWVVAGPVNKPASTIDCYFSQSSTCAEDANELSEIRSNLQKFWELEEIEMGPMLSENDEACENHFLKTTTRDSEGRFVVSLPLKIPVTKLGESLGAACKRLSSLENKFVKGPEFKRMYVDFMREYAQLGHMEKVKISSNDICYYMPHSGVLREESLTTKLRVVFDASSPSSTGFSLNHLQRVGPTIQQDLLSILLRFRQHKYVVAADIAKMYRQVLINPEQRCLQRILWRENPEDEIDEWELKTVTYGTAAASFLVIRCLFQLADENSTKYPDLAEIIKSDFYVDDLLTGADTIDAAAKICKGVADILKQGCFNLRKFYSNEREVLNLVDDERSEKQVIDFGEFEHAKTLGIIWCPSSDFLQYKVSIPQIDVQTTKRVILSGISKIFDPLGLLGPCIIRVKILLQKLWLEKLTWEEPVPLPIHARWKDFVRSLHCLDNLRIERRTLCECPRRIEMHGFCDASEAAYGGCIFLRSVDENGDATVNLLCAKCKVAPLKTISLPRLELMGALVLARLAKKVRTSLKVKPDVCIFWSDSTIVLNWLRTEPCKLKAFVSNRVSEIQHLTGSHQWRHVSSGDNPADALSRGVKPKEILDLHVWWHGPLWLREHERNWPNKKVCCTNLPDIRKASRDVLLTRTSHDVFERFSNLSKLKRTYAWVIRFVTNSKIKVIENRATGNLSFQEIQNAFIKLLRIAQEKDFSKEIRKLSERKRLDKTSKLMNLNPFIDNDKIMRVGGRLAYAEFSFEKKHPVILSSDCHISKLLVREHHVRLLHAGPSHVLANVREEFWIIGGRRLCNKVISQCTTCYRFKASSVTPIMAPLPKLRLNPQYPFAVTGVDYAGPFMIKSKTGRGFRLSKAYICLFICFTVKAIHMELVHELTKDAFMAALRRFVSRRGKPSIIYSDNATNFAAASKELSELTKFITSNGNEIELLAQKEGIEWKFIPPYSPHFGGLWEAGVKSAKFHLKRILKDVHLTFEQFYTILVQVEAILNSRPLSALSNSPDDLVPLTPAHFLVGRPLTAVPDHDVSSVPANRLSMYQHLQQIVQHLWKRWSKEYVSELQTRVKWHASHNELKRGALVLLKEDNQPPLKWKLGRVEEIHPGKDGIARVATVRTQDGPVKRSFSKLCPLPMEEDEEQCGGLQ